MIRFFHTFAGRIILSMLLVHIILLPILFGGIYILIKQGYQTQFVDYVRHDSQLFTRYLTQDLGKRDKRRIIENALSGENMVYLEITIDGYALSPLGANLLATDLVFKKDSYFNQGDDNTYFIEVLYISNDGAVTGNIRLGYDEVPTMKNITTIKNNLLYIVLGYIFVTTIVIFIVVPTLIRPLRTLRLASREIADGNQDVCFTTKSNLIEINNLAKDLENMRVRLAGSYARIAENEARVSSIVDHVADAIITINWKGTIESFNQAAENVFGYASSDCIGENISFLMPEPVASEHDHYLSEYLSGKGSAFVGGGTREVSGKRKDGSVFPMELQVSELWLGEERIFTGIIRDIIERKKTEEILRRSHDELEAMVEKRTADLKQTNADLIIARDLAMQAVQTKSRFLATMSHEIRTPMNGVMGMLSLLQDEEMMNDESRENVEIALSSAKSLMRILNDILDFSKMEAGKLSLEYIDFGIRPIIDDLVMLLGKDANEKGVELRAEIYDDVPDIVYSDPTRLRQMLNNLISNAIKFTQEGSVTVSVNCNEDVQDNQDRIVIKFSVIDTGVGISEKARPYIFDPFTQEDDTTTRQFGGTGLGLSICKQLVEQMDGEIGVDSIVDKGSTFWMNIPFARENGSLSNT